MILNTVCTFLVVGGAKEKNKSILYIKARNNLFVELSDKYSNIRHTKQNNWVFVKIYKSVP